MINEIINATNKLIRKKGSCIIAIDGRCGSGKTTLAKILSSCYDCNVIHMDDFFLRPCQRTEDRLKEPGGNVDRERFHKEVLQPICSNESFSYRPFNCHKMDFSEQVNVTRKSVTIIEGSYSCHPELFKYYDLHVFVDVNKKSQLERLAGREGEERIAVFEERWIPLEETYFSQTEIKYKCEIYYKTSV